MVKAVFIALLMLSALAQDDAADADKEDDEEGEEEEGPIMIDGFTEEEFNTLEAGGEQFEFQADVARVMDIIINSLYTNKEIFLRETISNASDALDKIRYMAITDPEVLGDGENRNLEVKVEFDEENKTISITDRGVAMTKSELIKNLGTVASSGTLKFAEALASGGDINLIGQFGVGFYSNFLVAEKITVTSKSNDDDQHVWVSTAGNTFSVIKDPRGNTLGRGTRVTLHLKQDAYEYVNQKKLKEILTKYSEFVNYPIYLLVEKDVSREVPLTDDELEARAEGDEKDTKVIKEKVWEWEQVNENQPIWLRDRDEIEEEEYSGFYKSISKDSRDPMSYIHFTAEGELDFTALLYIPSQAPYDMFQNYYGKGAPVKLYVRRVLITENFEELVPRFLNFIRGVVDSNDLPLNVSRENLQQKKILKLISKKITRKILQELKELAEEDLYEDDEEEDEDYEEEEEVQGTGGESRYIQFYKQFGKNLKLGLMDDPANKGKISKLLRFFSSASLEDYTSFDDYIARMKVGQEDIYWIAGEDKYKLKESPIIQQLSDRGYEVLILDDSIDEYTMNTIPEYEKHKLQNVSKNDWSPPWDEDDLARLKEKKIKEMYDPMIDWWKQQIQGKVQNIVLSKKLVDEICIITTADSGNSANLERLNKAQAFASSSKSDSGNNAQKTLEINPGHPVMKRLMSWAVSIPNDEVAKNIAMTLYDMALLNSGFVIGDPIAMYKRVQALLFMDMDLDPKEPVEDPELDISEEDYEDEEDEEEEESLDDTGV